MNFQNKKIDFIAYALLVVITVVVYYSSLFNDFVNWDDPAYIMLNEDIKEFSFQNMLRHFTIYQNGNYHPFTMMVYIVEFHFFRYNPFSYHLVNLIFHVFNSILVYVFIKKLTEQFFQSAIQNLQSKIYLIPFITAFLFAVHPMHVESVAWISELKDVLYTFFYLLSLIFYLKHLSQVSNPKSEILNRNFFYCLFFFLLSLFSKGMAVVLPFVLTLIDYLTGRKIFERKNLIEKSIFYALGFVFGIVAIKAQVSSDAFSSEKIDSVVPLIIYFTYRIWVYTYKLILPISLKSFYRYPYDEHHNYFSSIAYFTLLVIPFFAGWIYYLIKNQNNTTPQEKKNILEKIFSIIIPKQKNNNRIVLFGVIFFFINIILVIQPFAVGAAIVAERYTYLSYIGLFFILSLLIHNAISLFIDYRKEIVANIIIILIVYSFLAWQRTKIWKSTEILWTDCIEKDSTSFMAYTLRGNYHLLNLDYDKAMVDFNKAIQSHEGFNYGYYNRGLTYYFTRKYDLAIKDFETTLLISPNFVHAYEMMGDCYDSLKMPEQAKIYRQKFELVGGQKH